MRYKLIDYVVAVAVIVVLFAVVWKVTGLLMSFGITNKTILSIVGIAILIFGARFASTIYDKTR
ncbi:MAG: hypothetical protein IJ418_12095 [Clostridia bacterium]|nr:hypothetical protein [Clostridia bacterium]